MAVASGGRAFFTVESNGPFFCQFNPKELKLEDTAAWKPSDEHGQGKPLLTYERGQPAVLTMDLVFDETHSNGSVQGKIDALRAMTFPSVPVEPSGHRPPHVDFHWAGFEFKGIVEKVSASALMFKPDGTAIRAKVSVTMKERKEDGNKNTGAGSQVTLSAMGQMVQGASATTTTIQPNQTLSQAAASAGTSFRAMARANPQVNPLEPVAGQQVVIPGSEQLANVLANNALGVSPSNTSPMGDINPFALDEGESGFGGLDDLGDGDLSSFFNSAIDAVEDKAHELLDVVEDEVHDIADDVIDEAVEIGDKVGLGDEIEGLRDDAHDGISDGADQGHEEIDEAADKAHEVADEVVEKANEVVDKVQEEAHELLDKAEDKAHEVADDVIDAGVSVGDKVGMGDKVEGVREDAHGAISDGADSGHEEIDGAADAAHDFIGGGE